MIGSAPICAASKSRLASAEISVSSVRHRTVIAIASGRKLSGSTRLDRHKQYGRWRADAWLQGYKVTWLQDSSILPMTFFGFNISRSPSIPSPLETGHLSVSSKSLGPDSDAWLRGDQP